MSLINKWQIVIVDMSYKRNKTLWVVPVMLHDYISAHLSNRKISLRKEDQTKDYSGKGLLWESVNIREFNSTCVHVVHSRFKCWLAHQLLLLRKEEVPFLHILSENPYQCTGYYSDIKMPTSYAKCLALGPQHHYWREAKDPRNHISLVEETAVIGLSVNGCVLETGDKSPAPFNR